MLFSDEHLTAFPDVNIILTIRDDDDDESLKFVEKIYNIIRWKSMRLLAKLNPVFYCDTILSTGPCAYTDTH